MAKLVVFGAGDIARLAHFYFSTDSEHEVVGFAVDPAYRTAAEFQGLPLVSTDQLISQFPPSAVKMFVALSYARMNSVRAEKYAMVKGWGYELVSYVSTHCSNLSQFPPVLVDHSVRLSCPRHRDVVMLRRRFSTAVPVEIDECPQCGGVWLDSDELAQIRR